MRIGICASTPAFTSFLQAIAAADYRVSLEGTPGLAERFLAFARQPQIKTLKRSKKGPKEVDIRPLVLACDGEEGEGGRVQAQWGHRSLRI